MSDASNLVLLHVPQSEAEATAREMFQAGLNDDATRILKAQLHAAPDNGSCWEMLGVILLSDYRIEESVSALESASTLIPLSTGARIALANGYSEQGFHAAAETVLDFLNAEELSTELLETVAAIATANGSYFHAFKWSREAANRNPDCDRTVFNVARNMRLCGYPNHFIMPVLQETIRLAPDVHRYRILFAQLAYHCEDMVSSYGAIANLTIDAIENTTLVDALDLMSELYEWAGDEVRAEACRLRSLNFTVRETKGKG